MLSASQQAELAQRLNAQFKLLVGTELRRVELDIGRDERHRLVHQFFKPAACKHAVNELGKDLVVEFGVLLGLEYPGQHGPGFDCAAGYGLVDVPVHKARRVRART